MKAIPVAAFLVMAMAGVWPQAAVAMKPEEAQSVFSGAQADMASGHALEAIAKLERLNAEAPTPRVRLELARLYLATGEAVGALRLFREVYDDPATPREVKMNILPFMEQAELRVFRLRHGVRMATDTNPSKTADGGTIYFNGVPFEYQPPASRNVAYGIEPWVSAEKMWDSGLLGKFYGSTRLFEDPDYDSASVHVSVGVPVPNISRSMATFGVDTRVGKKGSYALPSVDLWKRFRPADGVDLGVGAQVGYFFNTNEAASGGYYRPYAFASTPFLMGTSAFARVSLEHMNAKNDYYTYHTPKVEVGIGIEVGGLNASPKIELSKSFYSQYDAFWGVNREDFTVRPSLAVSHDSLSWNGYMPEMTLSYEKRSSNIFIHEYKQFGGSLNFKKIF